MKVLVFPADLNSSQPVSVERSTVLVIFKDVFLVAAPEIGGKNHIRILIVFEAGKIEKGAEIVLRDPNNIPAIVTERAIIFSGPEIRGIGGKVKIEYVIMAPEEMARSLKLMADGVMSGS